MMVLRKKTGRQIITGVLLVAAGAFPAWGAVPDGDGGCAGHCQGKGSHREHFLAKLADALGLNDAQKAKIKGILEAEREKKKGYFAEMKETRKKLHEALQAPAVNEQEVRTLAAKKGQLETEVAVSMARTRNAAREVLTPEQRALAEKLLPLLTEARRGHGPQGRFGGHFPHPMFGPGAKGEGHGGCGCMKDGHPGDGAGVLDPEEEAPIPAE